MKFYYIFAVIFAILVILTTPSFAMPGGWSKQDNQSTELRDIWNKDVAPEFLQQFNAGNEINTKPFIVEIHTQVVAGLNIKYVIRYNNQLYEVKAFRDLNGKASLTNAIALP